MRVLITGGTGQVGSNIIKVARDKYQAEVIATLFSGQPEVPWNVKTVLMNLEDGDSIRQVIREHRPDAVIHCAFPRDLDRLELDHEWSWRIMVTGTQIMAKACNEIGARLVFISSDWVFGEGGRPPYKEDSPPCPPNYYGVMKVVGETLVASLCEDYAVARIAGVYGPNWSFPSYEQTEEDFGFGRLADYLVHRLSRCQPVVIWTKHVNVRANPTLASDIGDAVLTICSQNQKGIFHCCGRDSVTRLELAEAVGEVFDFDKALIQAASEQEMADLGRFEGRRKPPEDTRLEVAYTEARLGRVNAGVYDGLEQFRRQLTELGKLRS